MSGVVLDVVVVVVVEDDGMGRRVGTEDEEEVGVVVAEEAVDEEGVAEGATAPPVTRLCTASFNSLSCLMSVVNDTTFCIASPSASA